MHRSDSPFATTLNKGSCILVDGVRARAAIKDKCCFNTELGYCQIFFSCLDFNKCAHTKNDEIN